MTNRVLGILNVESYNVHVAGIDDYRPASAASFLGRYRVLDFMISNLTNSKIDSIQLYIKDRPRSSIEHVTGTEYNINTKRGRIQILNGEKAISNELYNTDIANFMANMQYIEESPAAYVVLAPTHYIYAVNFAKMLEAHIAAKNDITVLYKAVNDAKESYLLCDRLTIEDDRIKAIGRNHGVRKHCDISLEAYILAKPLFIELVKEGFAISSLFWFRDALKENLQNLKVGVYQHKGYAACINTLKAYYRANMQLREANVLKSLINPAWPIYTKTNDTCPTLYKSGAQVNSSIIGNGCEIEGTVSGSVIGRNVIIKKGACVLNSVVMPDVLINKDIKITNAVIDRYAIITHIKELKGDPEELIYVKRRDRI